MYLCAYHPSYLNPDRATDRQALGHLMQGCKSRATQSGRTGCHGLMMLGGHWWMKRWKDGKIKFSIEELEGTKHHETPMFFSTCRWTQHGAKKLGSGKSRIQSWTAGQPGVWPFVMVQACAKGVPVRNWLSSSMFERFSIQTDHCFRVLKSIWMENATKYN